MTIEFHCPHCDKLLRTPDDKAGVQAKCPGCGETVTVPAPAARQEAADFDEMFGGPPPAERMPAGADSESGQSAEVEDSSAADETKNCPMCGAAIKAAAVRCRFCGENLLPTVATGMPTLIDAGDVLSRAWTIYQREMALCIGAVILAGFLNFLSGVPANIFDALGQNKLIDPVVAGLIQVPLTLASMAFDYFLAIGQAILLLKIARGERAEISDLFSGGRYFWRGLGAGVLFGMMVLVGILLCIIPGFIVALMFGPFLFVLVDKDVGAVESLSMAKTFTTNNLLALVVLALAGLGLSILGILACLIGLIFVAPYLALTNAVAYLAMSGQPTGEIRRM